MLNNWEGQLFRVSLFIYFMKNTRLKEIIIFDVDTRITTLKYKKNIELFNINI